MTTFLLIKTPRTFFYYHFFNRKLEHLQQQLLRHDLFYKASPEIDANIFFSKNCYPPRCFLSTQHQKKISHKKQWAKNSLEKQEPSTRESIGIFIF